MEATRLAYAAACAATVQWGRDLEIAVERTRIAEGLLDAAQSDHRSSRGTIADWQAEVNAATADQRAIEDREEALYAAEDAANEAMLAAGRVAFGAYLATFPGYAVAA